MRIPAWLDPIREKLAPIHRKIRIFAVDILLKKIIVPIVLFLAYFFGVGLTAIFSKIFRARMYSKPMQAGSYWIKAEGYDPNEVNAREQS
jgi:hypothetical protein